MKPVKRLQYRLCKGTVEVKELVVAPSEADGRVLVAGMIVEAGTEEPSYRVLYTFV